MWVMSKGNCLELFPCNFSSFKLIFRMLTSLKITKAVFISMHFAPNASWAEFKLGIQMYFWLWDPWVYFQAAHNLNIIVYYFLFSTWVEIGSQQHHKNLAISRASSFIYCTFCDGRLHIRMFLFTKVSLNCSSSWTVHEIDPCTVSGTVKV